MCPFCFYFCMQIILKTVMEDKKSLAGAWVEAARPRTLPASVSPVLLGCALAYYDGMFDITPAVLCLLVALFAQIASNFANDYFDFKKGADREDRGYTSLFHLLYTDVEFLLVVFLAICGFGAFVCEYLSCQ